MGISTSTGTLTAGQSRTFNLAPASAVTLTLSPNVRVTITETPATVAATGLGGNASRVHEPRLPGVVTYGPYPMGGSVLVEVESNSGSSVGWVRSDSIVAESADGAQYLVDGAGNELVLFANPGADKLMAPVQHLESTTAISTTVTTRITPTGTYRTARIAWTNNGASGAAKLYIAANCGNDVEGLAATQSALQRDAQITMGEAVILASPVPITSLNFSADGAITGATHQILVSFGA